MIYERLILDKSKLIYVSENHTQKLKQHQIDGLRFLYHYFNKEPGVIFNDPGGSGRSVQILLFINAIKHSLKHPALILSGNIIVEKLKMLFHEWFANDSDVIFDSSKPYVDKKIFVNSWQELSTLSRREWGVIVVYNEECSVNFMKTLNSLKTSYKIVVITSDLKINLQTFSNIFAWINPEKKVSLESILPRAKTLIQIIQLDCIFEDKVIRRNKVGGTFETPQVYVRANPVVPQEVTSKNKDITGTKIKRSRKKVEDYISKSVCEVNTDEFNKIVIPSSNTSEFNYIGRKRKFVFNVESEEDVVSNVESDNKAKQVKDNILKDDVPNNSNVLNENKDEGNEVIVKETVIHRNKIDEANLNTLDEINDEILITKDITNNSNVLNENKDEGNEVIVKETVIHHNKIDEANLNTLDEINDEMLITKKPSDYSSNNEVLPLSLDKDVNSFIESDEIKRNEMNLNVSDIKNELDESEVVKDELNDSEIVKDKVNDFDIVNKSIADFDRKLKALEENAMKKYKGTILDTLF